MCDYFIRVVVVIYVSELFYQLCTQVKKIMESSWTLFLHASVASRCERSGLRCEGNHELHAGVAMVIIVVLIVR